MRAANHATPKAGVIDLTPVHGSRRTPMAWLELVLFRAVIGGLAKLPWSWTCAFAGGLARLAKRVDRRHTEAARGFLTTALGEGFDPRERERLILRAYRHVALVALESERFQGTGAIDELRRRFEVVAEPGLREQLADTGVIAITAHVGNWELSSAVVADWLGKPLYAVAKPPKNYYFSRYVQSSRESRGVYVLPRRGAMHEAPKVLAAGAVLGMLLDQRARTKPVMADFFGRPARCDRSAGVLLRRLSMPMLLLSSERLEGDEAPGRDGPYFRLHLGPLWSLETFAGSRPEEIARRINAEFERMILARPDQYLWLHDRYKDADPA
jgi:KDO2-lipid IV(A) lauroyltransferase